MCFGTLSFLTYSRSSDNSQATKTMKFCNWLNDNSVSVLFRSVRHFFLQNNLILFFIVFSVTVSMWNETHIRRLNQSLAAMSVDDLKKLQPKAVQNTIETLGKTMMSKDKGSALADKLPGGKMMVR